MDILFEIGKKIQEIRKEKNITQKQLAEYIDISRYTLSKIENGRYEYYNLLQDNGNIKSKTIHSN